MSEDSASCLRADTGRAGGGVPAARPTLCAECFVELLGWHIGQARDRFRHLLIMQLERRAGL